MPLLLLAGCTPPGTLRLNQSAACIDQVAEFTALVTEHGVADAQYHHLPSLPLLRIDRLQQWLLQRVDNYKTRLEWLERTALLSREGYRTELTNLRSHLELDEGYENSWQKVSIMESQLDNCLQQTVAILAEDQTAFGLLRNQAEVPDVYSDLKRLLGLYPLTRYLSLIGYRRWQEDISRLYRLSLDELPLTGELKVYSARSSDRSSRSAPTGDRWQRNGIGVPVIDPEELERLYDFYAPRWAIDTVSTADLPGQPRYRQGEEQVSVDYSKAVEYRHLSHTIIDDLIMPQLNYMIWFPQRPADSLLDLYAGRIDGLILRVTLDESMQPVLYDTIHPCGCYHLFYPRQDLQLLPATAMDEGYFVPQPLPHVTNTRQLTVRITSSDHQLVRLYADLPAVSDKPLTALPYDSLRGLEKDGNTRSMFLPNGLVAGSERLEEWFLWPMGVARAGAMRQWGHHATTLVGKRHFDDPMLIMKGFATAQEKSADNHYSNDLVATQQPHRYGRGDDGD